MRQRRANPLKNVFVKGGIGTISLDVGEWVMMSNKRNDSWVSGKIEKVNSTKRNAEGVFTPYEVPTQ